MSYINQVLEYAVESEYISSKPLAKLSTLRRPKNGRQIRVDKFFKPAEQVKIYRACEAVGKPWLGVMYLFGCWTGLRKEELLAVSWEDVSFEEKVIHVHRKLTSDELGDPKTELSARPVILNDFAIKILKKAKEYTFDLKPVIENVMRAGHGGYVQETFSPIFMNFSPEKKGLPGRPRMWNSSSFRRAWDRKNIGIKVKPGRNKAIANVRHTYTTYLLSTGSTHLHVAYQLGHTNEQMVRQRYGELTGFFDDKSVKVVAALIEGF
jgi:integrase